MHGLTLYFLFVPPPALEPWGLKYCFFLTGAYGPEHWVTSSVSCGGHHQSPIDIVDQHARVGEEYQELQLDGFDNESSNKTWMKNTGKTGRLCLLHLSTNKWSISGCHCIYLNEDLLLHYWTEIRRMYHWVRALGSSLSYRNNLLLLYLLIACDLQQIP